MTYTPFILGTGVAGYSFVTRTREQQQSLFAQSANVQRDLDTFKSEIENVHTSDELLDNFQLLRVSLGAFGLDEDISNRGFLKAVLDSDLNDDRSFVNRLSDPRYREFAEAFNFGGTPSLDELSSVDEVKAQVQALSSADDLLGDGALLRAALETFGLQDDQRNTHFLKLVLNSDLSDPNSFANGLSDTRYAEFAESFGFGARAREQASLLGFAEAFAPELDNLETAQDLLDRPELLEASFTLFGLDGDSSDTDFWGNVLNSDVSDEASFANQQDDPRYAALSRAFGFGDPDTTGGSGKLETLVNAVQSRPGGYTDVNDFFGDFSTLFATLDFLDLPRTGRSVGYAGRVLGSDASDPTSLINLEPDPRYAALQQALNFQPVEEGHVYPDGFADALAQRYVDRQFEIQIGNSDNSMRVALAFDRDLDAIASNSVTTNNSKWFAVMASGPLRAVFETVFGLPDAFGTLDVDQQLDVFKERSLQLFGSSELADLNTEEQRERVRSQYLFQSDLALTGQSNSATAVLALLA